MEEGGRKFNVNKQTRRYMAAGCAVALAATLFAGGITPEVVSVKTAAIWNILLVFVAGCGGTELVHGGFNAMEHNAKAKS